MAEQTISGGLRSQGFEKRSLPGKPLISVITVVFNGADTIRDAIESVQRQTYGNIEYIVVDGGSSDGTVDILRHYEQGIDFWLSEKDRGIYDAMNKGIALCTGDYVGMLNADDLFSDQDVLQAVADRFLQTGVDAVFSCLNIVRRDEVSKIIRRCRVARFTPAMLRIGVMPPHPTFYCRRSCLEDGGLYRTDYHIAADFERLVRMLVRQKISWSFIDRVTVVMRSGGLSNSGLAARLRLNREIVRACRENGLYTNFLLLALKIPLRLAEFF